jgi:tetratricopeptide (TPR) repeat protein
MDRLEYIDDYFKGLLSEEQKKQLEQSILSDPAFAEELAFYINTRDLLIEELREEKKERFKTIYQQIKPSGIARSTVRRFWPYVAAAASVIFVLVGFWWIINQKASPERLAERYITRELQNFPVKMGGTKDSLQGAINEYNTNDLSGALVKFEEILASDKSNELARQYAGIVYLRLKEYDKALSYFRLLETDRSLYTNPAVFYESLTLMKREGPGDTQEARKLLQEVIDRNLDKKEDAQQLLNSNW